MLQLSMKCIYCKNEKLYKLKSGHLKCWACKKKFSPKKIQTDLELIECFCQNLTIHQASQKMGINYITAKNRYELFRKLITNHAENAYKDKSVLEYDEYIYLQKSKRKVKENIFDAQNFLTFTYEDKVYNILMPNLNKYKNQFLGDGAEEVYFKEFSKFMMQNKISKTKKRENILTQFWLFFEDAILKYKGVSGENFIYYLKEIEFKFNYKKEEQEKLLRVLVQNTFLDKA